MNLSLLLDVFANNLLPILLISGAGFILGKTLSLDPRMLGRVVFYLFSPLLVFDLLINSKLNARESMMIIAFAIVIATAVGTVAYLCSKLLRMERPSALAIVLVATFGNGGNYGLPLVSFAFGEDALAHATVYFVTTAILMNTVGVLIASLGHLDLKGAALGMFKVPTIYGAILAGFLNLIHFTIPIPLARTISLASGGAIPLMIVLLGMELTRVEWSHSWRALGLGVFMRLIIGPMIGLIMASLFGFTGAARQGTLTQSAMPAAVTTSVIASEYHLEPALVTAIVFFGTALSPLTLTPLLVYLGR